DGTSYLDDRAENGTRYRYWIAAEDRFGHTSGLSPSADGFPRPDFHAEVIYEFGDQPAASGFRFVVEENSGPIVSGSAVGAQWRLETVGGALHLVPLGQTRITAGQFTTALTCGPGSDATCEDIRIA